MEMPYCPQGDNVQAGALQLLLLLLKCTTCERREADCLVTGTNIDVVFAKNMFEMIYGFCHSFGMEDLSMNE